MGVVVSHDDELLLSLELTGGNKLAGECLHSGLCLTRQNAMGYSNVVARMGVMVAPLILLLEDVWTPLPQIIICIGAIFCGLSTLLLPETLNARLPETIDDIEQPRSLN